MYVCVFGILNVGYLTFYVCIYTYIHIYAILGMPWGNGKKHSYAAWSMCCSMKNTVLRWWLSIAMLHYWRVGCGRFVGYDLGY